MWLLFLFSGGLEVKGLRSGIPIRFKYKYFTPCSTSYSKLILGNNCSPPSTFTMKQSLFDDACTIFEPNSFQCLPIWEWLSSVSAQSISRFSRILREPTYTHSEKGLSPTITPVAPTVVWDAQQEALTVQTQWAVKYDTESTQDVGTSWYASHNSGWSKTTGPDASKWMSEYQDRTKSSQVVANTFKLEQRASPSTATSWCLSL